MYDVGQILYLLSKKNNKIVPARVESVVTVKRVGGVDVTHEVVVIGHEQQIELEKLNVEIFMSPDQLREHLLKLIVDQVDAELNEIAASVKETWTTSIGITDADSAVLPDTLPPTPPQIDGDVVQVELENGMQARVHMPKELM